MARDMNRPTMKISYNAPVALTFALLSLLALVANHFTNGWANATLFSVYRCSLLADPLGFFRFFGHVLGHSGYAHYIGNMVLILVLGPNLEDRFGSWNVLWAILFTAPCLRLPLTLLFSINSSRISSSLNRSSAGIQDFDEKHPIHRHAGASTCPAFSLSLPVLFQYVSSPHITFLQPAQKQPYMIPLFRRIQKLSKHLYACHDNLP